MRELLTAVNSVTMDLDFAGCTWTELERNWCNSPFWKKTSFLWKAHPGHCLNLCNSKGTSAIRTELNTYYIFNSCLRDAWSRQTENYTKQEIQTEFCWWQRKKILPSAHCSAMDCHRPGHWSLAGKKAQLTCIFCLRIQATNSEMLEGILKIKMNLCCLDCVVATWNDCFNFYI